VANFVLDAWAIMAWLKGQQPAAQRVRLLLESAERRERKLIMNIVNAGEVFYLSAKARDLAYAGRVLDALRARIGILAAPNDLVMLAAGLKARHAISYADAFAAATALMRDTPLVTGDPELQALAAADKTLQLEWIGA
jgi:ribonuclease VapC